MIPVLRCSYCVGLMQELLQAGCVYQERHGWERPGWFMASAEKEKGLPEVGCLKKLTDPNGRPLTDASCCFVIASDSTRCCRMTTTVAMTTRPLMRTMCTSQQWSKTTTFAYRSALKP